MRNLLALSIFPGFIIALGANAAAEPLLILVHNYANVDPTVLKQAEKSAAAALGTGGVEVHWLDCPETGGASQQCQNPADPPVLALQLLPANASRRGAPSSSLGFAIPPEPGQFGSFAGVFYDRVEKLGSRGFSEPVILGHAMAHEIGHLLLGVEGHSDRGIMKAEWHANELEQAKDRTLSFNPMQRSRMRQNVTRRLAANSTP
jgi:hypothetical protein